MSAPGHFGKRLYDSFYFPEIVRQETAPGNYRLYDGEWNNNSKCGSLLGPRQNRPSRIGATGEYDAGSISQRAEIESLFVEKLQEKYSLNERDIKKAFLKFGIF
jgi:hypothetical protein